MLKLVKKILRIEKIKNLGQNFGHFGPKFSKTFIVEAGAIIKHRRVPGGKNGP